MKNRAEVLTVLLLALLPSLGHAGPGQEPSGRTGADWPQWRGPNRDAVSAETGLAEAWPAAGPQEIWRVPIGPGYSGVSVSDGKLYTLWDKSDWQFLFCLDASTGEPLWKRGLGPAFENAYGDGPRSTPLVDEERVYAIGTGGLLLAADRNTGEVRWKHDLVKEFDAQLPSYGYASSPLRVGDKLIVEAGGKNAAFVAFDREDGSVAWTAGTDAPAYSSPIQISIGGVGQVVFWSAHGLHAVATDDGTGLWDHAWETFCPVTGSPLNTGTPIFIPPDRIYLSSGSGAAAVRITRVGGAFQVETVWEQELMRSDVNTAVLLDDVIYGFDGGILKSLDATTGEVRWKARGFRKESLIAADAKLLVLGEAGNLALVEATSEGFVQRSSAQVLEGKSWTAPTLSGGKLYLRNHEELVCLDVAG